MEARRGETPKPAKGARFTTARPGLPGDAQTPPAQKVRLNEQLMRDKKSRIQKAKTKSQAEGSRRKERRKHRDQKQRRHSRNPHKKHDQKKAETVQSGARKRGHIQHRKTLEAKNQAVTSKHERSEQAKQTKKPNNANQKGKARKRQGEQKVSEKPASQRQSEKRSVALQKILETSHRLINEERVKPRANRNGHGETQFN
jgi:hypothetical protein